MYWEPNPYAKKPATVSQPHSVTIPTMSVPAVHVPATATVVLVLRSNSAMTAAAVPAAGGCRRRWNKMQ